MKDRYPEHTKLDKVKDKSQAIADFIEWVENNKEIELCGYPPDSSELVPISCLYISLKSLLAEFFGVDTKKLEDEKDLMLKDLKEINGE